jgi:hypothetical protein
MEDIVSSVTLNGPTAFSGRESLFPIRYTFCSTPCMRETLGLYQQTSLDIASKLPHKKQSVGTAFPYQEIEPHRRTRRDGRTRSRETWQKLTPPKKTRKTEQFGEAKSILGFKWP